MAFKRSSGSIPLGSTKKNHDRACVGGPYCFWQIVAVTVATHTDLWVVFVRCTEALDDNEKTFIERLEQPL